MSTAGQPIVGDFDNDGDDEIVVSRNYYQTIKIWDPSGGDYDEDETNLNSGGNNNMGDEYSWKRLATGDLDGDGDDEIVVTRDYYQKIKIWDPSGGAYDEESAGTNNPPADTSDWRDTLANWVIPGKESLDAAYKNWKQGNYWTTAGYTLLGIVDIGTTVGTFGTTIVVIFQLSPNCPGNGIH